MRLLKTWEKFCTILQLFQDKKMIATGYNKKEDGMQRQFVTMWLKV